MCRCNFVITRAVCRHKRSRQWPRGADSLAAQPSCAVYLGSRSVLWCPLWGSLQREGSSACPPRAAHGRGRPGCSPAAARTPRTTAVLTAAAPAQPLPVLRSRHTPAGFCARNPDPVLRTAPAGRGALWAAAEPGSGRTAAERRRWPPRPAAGAILRRPARSRLPRSVPTVPGERLSRPSHHGHPLPPPAVAPPPAQRARRGGRACAAAAATSSLQAAAPPCRPRRR